MQSVVLINLCGTKYRAIVSKPGRKSSYCLFLSDANVISGGTHADESMIERTNEKVTAKWSDGAIYE